MEMDVRQIYTATDYYWWFHSSNLVLDRLMCNLPCLYCKMNFNDNMEWIAHVKKQNSSRR